MQPANLTPAWRKALDEAILADPRGRTGVAEKLEISRPYVSRVLTGSIAKPSKKFAARVAAVYLQVLCPHLGHHIPPATCRQFAQRTYSAISPQDVPHWRACRRCPHNTHNPSAALAAMPAAPAPGATES